jgi:DNA polymerase III subunit delta'
MKTWNDLSQIQSNVAKMLTNSITKNRLAHAYLFEGGRGTGKVEASQLVAKTLFCKKKNAMDPCGVCVDCKRIDSGNHPDVHIVQPDGQSIKIQQIRDLQKEFSYTGVESKKKMYLIQHADKMTVQAANSLLKFLEEPNRETMAILMTEQVHRILDTIISRCQTLSFSPLSPDRLIEELKKEDILDFMAKTSASLTNNLDEALVICNDEWFAQARNIVIKLNEVLLQRPHQALLSIQDDWIGHFTEREQYDRGFDLLLLWYKDLLYIQLGEERNVVFLDGLTLLKQQALHSSQKRVANQLTAILEAKKRLNANVNPHLLMEQLVLRLQEG